jgi:large subunit ribosomal protein L21
MMNAIISLGGTQHNIKEGDEIITNRISEDEGKTFVCEDVLMINNNGDSIVGTPNVKNAKVELEVEEHFKGDKVIAYKFKKRKRYERKKGHRQPLSRLRVKSIKYKKK